MVLVPMLLLVNAVFGVVNGKGCPAFWTKVNGQCFRLVSSIGVDSIGFPSFYHAQVTCQQYGGELATIKDAETENIVLGLLRNMSKDSLPRKVYVGMNDIEEEQVLRDNMGELTNYTNWAKNEPNNNFEGDEDCVVFKSPEREWLGSGETVWHDYPCCHQSYITHAICITEPGIPRNSSYLIHLLENKCNTVDECRSNPCQNGGTCQDAMMHYTCQCPYGVEGTYCEHQILCPLPGLAHAHVGEEHAESDVFPVYTEMTVTCETGYGVKPEDMKVVQKYNCTENGWETLQFNVTKCPPFPRWLDIDFSNSSGREEGEVVTYWCKDKLKFEDNEVNKTTFCNATGHWVPAFVGCMENKSKADALKEKEPVEATGAVMVGTFGLIFLVSELSFFVLIDTPTLIGQLYLGYSNVRSMISGPNTVKHFQPVPTAE